MFQLTRGCGSVLALLNQYERPSTNV